jgi:WD40 repeat protein
LGLFESTTPHTPEWKSFTTRVKSGIETGFCAFYVNADNTIHIWNVNELQLHRQFNCQPFFKTPSDEVHLVSLHPEYSHLLTFATKLGTIVVMDIRDTMQLWQQSWALHQWRIEIVQFYDKFLFVGLAQLLSIAEAQSVSKDAFRYNPSKLQVWMMPHEVGGAWQLCDELQFPPDWRFNLGDIPMIAKRMGSSESHPIMVLVHIWDPSTGDVFWPAHRLSRIDGKVSQIEDYRINHELDIPAFSRDFGEIYGWAQVESDQVTKYFVFDAYTGAQKDEISLSNMSVCGSVESRGKPRLACLTQRHDSIALYRMISSKLSKNPVATVYLQSSQKERVLMPVSFAMTMSGTMVFATCFWSQQYTMLLGRLKY